ncbi:MAG: hypothetical protein HC805_08215, partial [Alkalinema sp. RL_2_19]|nr:hypothetical protein [Alkalinema sp. RL_2_19]
MAIFVVFETNASNLVAGDFNGTGDVVGNSVRPTVSLDLLDTTAIEGSSSPADVGVYEISRNDSTDAITARLAVSNTSTASGTDYVITPDNPAVTIAPDPTNPNIYVVTIPAGVASVQLNVTAVDDAIAEAAELLQLNLEPNSTYTARNLSTDSMTIAANDTGVTSLSDQGEGSLRQALINANATPG